MKHIKLYSIIIIMVVVLVCGCTDVKEEVEEVNYPHWSPTPEQREMSTEELRELLEPIYDYKEKVDNLE